MARNDVYLYINATSPAEAVVTAQANVTAADFPELTLGDAPLFNFYFTDGTASWPTWAGNAQFTVDWALSDATSHSSQPYAYTTTATPISGGWQIRLPLNQSGLVDAVSAVRTSQAYPVSQLWQHIRVRDSNFNPVTYAMVRTNIRKRAMWDLATIAGTVDTDATVTGDLTVGGDLTVAGNTQVTVNSVTGLGTGVAAFLATPSSANLRTALTDETGSGSAVFSTSPTLVTPTLGAATATSLVVGGATGGATSGVVNAQGLQINGVPVGTSTDTYWSAVTGGIRYTGGLVQAPLNPATTTIGTNGPNLASSINTKAPRGGIAFDGTANSKATSTLTNQAITTDPFSVTIGFAVPSSNPSATRGIFAVSSASTGTAAYGFDGAINTSGSLTIIIRGAAITDYRQYAVANFVSTYANKVVQLCVVRPTSGDVVIYINGAVVTATETTGGTPPANWQATVTSTYFTYGTSYSGQEFVGTITNATFWNLALTAADVLEISEAGGAVPFRYQFGSQTGLITGNDSTFASDTGAWTKSGATISGGNLNLTSNQYAMRQNVTSPCKKYRAVIVATAASGDTRFGDTASAPTDYTAFGVGTTTYEFKAGTSLAFLIATGTGSATVDSVTLVQIGAVCHFALDDGIGYQLHDASTNKLDAVMTTTGVAHLIAKREGYVRTPSTGISWSGSHEPKNILGAASTQRMLPDGAVINQIVLKASGASTNGASVNSTNTAARWSAVAALSTTKSVRTIANSGLPAGTADADTDILIDPDTVNYTGTIQADVRYSLTEG